MAVKTHRIIIALCAVFGMVTMASGAPLITDIDSTQPRGFGGPMDVNHTNQCQSGGHVYNDQGQDLCPIIEGIYSPQHYVGNTGQGSQLRYFDVSKGMMMGNAARDPAFFATLSVANRDFTNLIYAAYAKGVDTRNMDLYNLVGLNTAREVACSLKIYEPASPDPCQPGNPIKLLPEENIPVTADLCLRCHFTAGWLEGRSEPPTPHFPYLKGQFWGAKFQEYPVDEQGNPALVDISKDSESDMQGIQCGYCHRQIDNSKRHSLYDDSTMARGSGGYFMEKYNPFTGDQIRPSSFQKTPVICGTCHDVTNPLVFTRKKVGGVVTPDIGYLHPIERTYTEWYWSHSPDCITCHVKMEFQGAQTWMIYPGLDRLWGAVDKIWASEPYNYNTYGALYDPKGLGYRTQAYRDARARSEALMSDAANVVVEVASANVANGHATVGVKITNNTGHKLPTGFAEGRQMWIHIKAEDSRGSVLYEDGVIDSAGDLVRTPETKVYEQVVLAEGYDNFEACTSTTTYDKKGRPRTSTTCKKILDANGDGTVSHYEKEFHFVLMNYIEKDNRIPPTGFNKAAYMADGAFIVPYGPKDTDYESGQNWDITYYTFPILDSKGRPAYRGDITVTAALKYQTFNKEYIDFLDTMDVEKTEEFGGRARNVPCNEGSEFCGYQTWGDVLKVIWTDANMGQPVLMGTASKTFRP